jgi:hypothetical protein
MAADREEEKEEEEEEEEGGKSNDFVCGTIPSTSSILLMRLSKTAKLGAIKYLA